MNSEFVAYIIMGGCTISGLFIIFENVVHLNDAYFIYAVSCFALYTLATRSRYKAQAVKPIQEVIEESDKVIETEKPETFLTTIEQS